MRLGLQMDYRLAEPFQRTAERVVALEAAGVDVLWLAEVYGYDAPTVLGALAARTSRVLLGSAILPLYSRSPALIAMTAAGLDYVSGGRAILGLGSSGPQVIEGWHGVPFDRPLGRTREVIEVCRRAWRRETLVHHGRWYPLPLPPERGGSGLGKPLKLLAHPLRERIPIYVAALGEQNVALAAELADGWLPLFFAPEHARAAWAEALRAGGQRRPASLEPLEVAAGGPLAITDDPVEARRLRTAHRAALTLYAGGMGAPGSNFYNALVARYGYAREAAQIQERFLAGHTQEAEAALPEALVEQTSLIGSAGFVRQRIAAYAAAGVTILNVQLVGGDPPRDVRLVRTWLG